MSTVGKKAKPAPSKLTPKQWAEVEALWEAGTTTLEDLSKRYDKATSTFVRHFKTHSIKRGSSVDEAKKRAAEVIANNARTDAAILAGRIAETKDEAYKMQSAVQRLAWNEILTAKNAGVEISTRSPNLKAIKDIAQILVITRTERYAILGLDRPDAVDPGELPELFISELTDEQIKELRDQDLTEIDDATTALIGLDEPPAEEDDSESDE